MSKSEALANLRACLASIYDDEVSAKRVCSDAGIRTETIDFEGSSEDRWFNIIEKSKQTGKLESLVKWSIKNSGSEELDKLFQLYLQEKDDPISPLGESDLSVKKKIWGVINGFIFVGLFAIIFQQYYSIKKIDDVKFEKAKFECLNEDCSIVREKFLIFRIGENAFSNVSLTYLLNEPGYELIPDSISLKQFHKSLFFSFQPEETEAVKIHYQDPDLNDTNSFGLRLKNLSPDQIYEFSLNVKSSLNKSSNDYAIFLIKRDEDNDQTKIKKNRNFYDYLRLYLSESLFFSILIVFILVVSIWFIGKTYIEARAGNKLDE